MILLISLDIIFFTYLFKIQCPSSNQPTQCHEARRGKCRMVGTGFRTGTMTVAYAYAAYAYVHSNRIQNHAPRYPKKCCCFWRIPKYPKSSKTQRTPPKKTNKTKNLQTISKRIQKYQEIFKTMGMLMSIHQKHPQGSTHIYEHVANTSILGTAC